MSEIDLSVSLDFFIFILLVAACMIFVITGKDRKDLNGWKYSFSIYAVGNLFKVLLSFDMGELKSTLLLLQILLYITAAMGIFYSIRKEYSQMMSERAKIRSDAFVPMLFAASASDNIILVASVVVLSLLIWGLFMLIQVWRIKRTPTHTFLLNSFVWFIFGIVTSVAFDTPEAGFIVKGFDTVSATLLLSTGIVISQENRLLTSESKVELAKQMAEQVQKNRIISDELKKMAEELAASSEEISQSSENIASSQQQISKGATTQSVAIQDVQKDFNELLVTVKQIIESMNDMDKITSIISGIAESTNMLALNAAIEAARAGESGRGFNVVAEQVRKLANESKSNANDAVSRINKVKMLTKVQEEKSKKIIEKIDSVATVAEETSASTEESAAAAEEQASMMEEISSNVQRLLYLSDQLTKEGSKVSDFVQEFSVNNTIQGIENKSK